MEIGQSPVLTLPEDPTRVRQLQAKLEEYKGRMTPSRAPETRMDTICKIAVLKRLLAQGKVTTWDLARELAANYGSGYDPNAFNNACAVIQDYCETGGASAVGGTGLSPA